MTHTSSTSLEESTNAQCLQPSYQTLPLSTTQELLHISSYTGVVTQKFFCRSCCTGVVTQELTSRWSTCSWIPTKLLLLKLFSTSLFRRQPLRRSCVLDAQTCGERRILWAWRRPLRNEGRCQTLVWNCNFEISDATISREMKVERTAKACVNVWFFKLKRKCWKLL